MTKYNTPGLLQKRSKKNVIVREYFRLVVFLGVFFRKFGLSQKIPRSMSCAFPTITVRI